MTQDLPLGMETKLMELAFETLVKRNQCSMRIAFVGLTAWHRVEMVSK